jgi:hypothetical protein
MRKHRCHVEQSRDGAGRQAKYTYTAAASAVSGLARRPRKRYRRLHSGRRDERIGIAGCAIRRVERPDFAHFRANGNFAREPVAARAPHSTSLCHPREPLHVAARSCRELAYVYGGSSFVLYMRCRESARRSEFTLG